MKFDKPVLFSPCAYQGGKQRIAKEIIDYILFTENIVIRDNNILFFDLCCGSGAITIEFINRGINPHSIIMCDISSWGKFWKSIGDGTFSVDKFNWYCNQVPKDKSQVHEFLKELSETSADEDEEYKYLLLQAGAFGGKQIWKEQGKWQNTSFRRYWQPTATSNRRSPVNPMQPSLETLRQRVVDIANNCVGLTVVHNDINYSLEKIKGTISQNKNGVVYIDPPYRNTTSYNFDFDFEQFMRTLSSIVPYPVYVSEKEPLSAECIKLNYNGEKGGICGYKKNNHQEWLSVFRTKQEMCNIGQSIILNEVKPTIKHKIFKEIY